MNLVTMQNPAQPAQERAAVAKTSPWRAWLASWEMYLILLLASFLRLYRIDTTSFSLDQANIFSTAYDAIHHGTLVATSNLSSLGTINPPAIIYLLMPPALFSPDPLWAAVWFAVLSILAVLITYLFVRRYFGRVAATIAALLFATVNTPVFYSRFIWNQNLLLLFAPLFIMTLLWGVVERRKGWFGLAVILLGFMYQLHGSSSLLVVALVMALLLVPRTVGWRDVFLAVAGLALLYFPYALWEVHVHFQDIAVLLNDSKQPSHFDTQALGFYQMLLGTARPGNFPYPPHTTYLHIIDTVNIIMAILLVGAIGMAGFQVVRGQRREQPAAPATGWWGSLRSWWRGLRADTYRSSLLLLLIWQIVPLLALSRHAIPEYPHYFIFFMPGPYILIALCLSRLITWLSGLDLRHLRGEKGTLYVLSWLFIALLVGTQFWASLWTITVVARGDFPGSTPRYGGMFILNSLQNALHEADQLALRRHFKHLYIQSFGNSSHISSEAYLARYTTTPATVFGAKCLILPSPEDGPAVLLVSPYNYLTDAMLPHFASATLVDRPVSLGDAPFELYIVQSMPAPLKVQATLPQTMQLLTEQRVSVQGHPWLATRWNMLRTTPAQDEKVNTYTLTNRNVPAGSSQSDQTRTCGYTSMQAGDQFISAFPLVNNDQASTRLQVQVQTSSIAPDTLHYQLFGGLSITFATYALVSPPLQTLLTGDNQDVVTIPIPR